MQPAGNKKPVLSDLGKALWAESQPVPEPCLKGPFSERRVSLKGYLVVAVEACSNFLVKSLPIF